MRLFPRGMDPVALCWTSISSNHSNHSNAHHSWPAGTCELVGRLMDLRRILGG